MLSFLSTLLSRFIVLDFGFVCVCLSWSHLRVLLSFHVCVCSAVAVFSHFLFPWSSLHVSCPFLPVCLVFMSVYPQSLWVQVLFWWSVCNHLMASLGWSGTTSVLPQMSWRSWLGRGCLPMTWFQVSRRKTCWTSCLCWGFQLLRAWKETTWTLKIKNERQKNQTLNSVVKKWHFKCLQAPAKLQVLEEPVEFYMQVLLMRNQRRLQSKHSSVNCCLPLCPQHSCLLNGHLHHCPLYLH